MLFQKDFQLLVKAPAAMMLRLRLDVMVGGPS